MVDEIFDKRAAAQICGKSLRPRRGAAGEADCCFSRSPCDCQPEPSVPVLCHPEAMREKPRPKTFRFIFGADLDAKPARDFEEVLGAVGSNRLDPQGRPAILVVERPA